MGKETGIEWCDHTFNPWRGCTKVSPGCQHCYAETLSKRNPAVLGEWGPDGKRAIAAESYWRLPVSWDAEAAHSGIRRRVFCASLADVFEDRDDLRPARLRLLGLIENTPSLDWLLLTKRPQNVLRVLGTAANDAAEHRLYGIHDTLQYWLDNAPPDNVWMGASVEDQQRAEDRVPALLRVPANVRFLSCEPLLGAVNLGQWLSAHDDRCDPERTCSGCNPYRGELHWVIIGGESGRLARLCHVEWAESLVCQCKVAGVAVFVKQLGSSAVTWPRDAHGPNPLMLGDKKGGDLTEWPAALRVREFPEVP